MGQVDRDEIIGFVRGFTKETKKTPSVRMILKKIHLNTNNLYKLFQSMDELCELANVDSPIDRKMKVAAALEAKTGQEEVDDKKKLYAVITGVQNDLERSRGEAILDVSKIPDYASKIVSLREPELWRRLQLLDRDVRSAINIVFENREDYLELMKKSIITKEKLVDFDEYVIECLRDYVSFLMEENGYSGALPSDIDGICPTCRSRLMYSSTGSRGPLFCGVCKGHTGISCPICDARMGQLPPNMLKCADCGYRLKFKRELVRQITSYEQYLDEVEAGTIGTHSNTKLFIEQVSLEGEVVHRTPVILFRGKKTGLIQPVLGQGFAVKSSRPE